MPKTKKRKRVLHLTDDAKFRAIVLGKYGGYSHAYIASVAMQKPLESITPEERHSIAAYLRHNGVLVTDWRNGNTSIATQCAGNWVKEAYEAAEKREKEARKKKKLAQ